MPLLFNIFPRLCTTKCIQGIRNILCHPEIATEDMVDVDDEFLFCLVNLATSAIQAFLGAHECNAYCEVVNIPDKE